MRKILSVLLSIVVMLSAVSAVPVCVGAATYSDQLKAKGFTTGYIDDLVALHNKYPNWTFVPLKTGLNWADVIVGERIPHWQQVVQKRSTLSNDYYCDCESCCKDGVYTIREGSSWVAASESAVKYYMDPRNWLDEVYIFQFESTKYSSSQTKKGVESVLSGTWMADSLITYKNTAGSSKSYDSTTKYSDAIMTAAKDSGMSAYYLASKIRQENGGSTASATAVCGTKSPFQGIYNYYNIGAYAGASDGLAWAAGFMMSLADTKLYSSYDSSTKKAGGTATSIKAGQRMTYRGSYGDYYRVRLYTENGPNSYTEGASGYVLKSNCRTTYFNYGRPWTDPYKAIYYGAQYIANSFGEQYTGYLQKFNVNPDTYNLYSHEYMTNVQGAAQEAYTTHTAYKNAGLLSLSRTFYIPVFNNMPSSKCKVGASVGTDPTVVTPAKVTGLKLDSRTTSSLTLKWDKMSGAKGYYLYRYYPDSASYKKVRTIKGASSVTTTITGLSPGAVRHYAVAAYADKVGAKSSRLSVATTPSRVSLTSVSALSDHRIKAKWSKVSGYATGYQIYWSRNSSFTNVVARTDVPGKSKVSYIGKNFNKGVRYYVKVRAYKTVNGKRYYGSWSKAKSVVSK